MSYIYNCLQANFANVFLSFFLVRLLCDSLNKREKNTKKLVVESLIWTFIIIFVLMVAAEFFPELVHFASKTFIITYG